ncbi:hypothetical protein E7Z59_11770 [Robertkochia marina]|uniref:Alginate export domain-containing protein n=1 Tax=Robertkochia marina TaxID=1227945 RepID=A0A4S3LY37_9FLAO|nr:alginate export family protein [Robertkochia marina]THD66472.1 hypothetical protein E7Z59_11770 [Robertkochia marina]TRZ44151.1 hypothetical protein D3A96_09585 [Robertkochia marina]
MRYPITLVLGLVLVCFSTSLFSQEFKADIDFRDRFEFRHGFNNLFPDGADPAAFVRQRARLNLDFISEHVDLKFAIQDISTWGDTRQILPQDENNSLMLFQAWARIKFNPNWSLKLGRQVISYDDQRILGGLDWAMQGRFHDAALARYQKDGFKADVAVTFNQQGERVFDTDFPIIGFFSYKSMQFLHMTKTWENTTGSFLFLNNGFQSLTGPDNDIAEGVFYRQTTGAFVNSKPGNWIMEGFAYYQSGEAEAGVDLSAYDIGFQGSYKPGSVLYGAGFEILSGTDQEGESKNKSFFPLYGTNHKFNGFMDYFYVGNHANNVGLNDVFARVVIPTGERANLLVKAHYFGANAELTGGADAYLGTEIDAVYTLNFFKFATLNVGYSHMFASDSMSLIKGGTTNDNNNYWAWAMIKINPTLLRHQWTPD